MSAGVLKNLQLDGCALESAPSIRGVAMGPLAAPASEAQAAAILRAAAAHEISVVPLGGGTAQGIGYAPQKNSVVLSTQRLNKLVHHEPGDMVATVQAGMTLGEFQAALSPRGQWLPLDGDERATLGGLIATDRHGPRALGYGTLRDMVLGMTVINGDGVLRKCGGRVVKNVTGYALDKLYIGSLGTLGLVTEVTFKLRPLPIGRRQWRIEINAAGDAIATLRRISDCNLPLEMLELQLESGKSAVVVAAIGAPPELDRIERDVQQAIAPASFAAVDASDSGSAAYRRVLKDEAALQVWYLSSKLETLYAMVSSTPRMCLGPQNGWLNVDGAALSTFCAKLHAAGIHYRVENAGAAEVKEPFGPPRAEWALMKRIKAALDPQGIMNRGRFVV